MCGIHGEEDGSDGKGKETYGRYHWRLGTLPWRRGRSSDAGNSVPMSVLFVIIYSKVEWRERVLLVGKCVEKRRSQWGREEIKQLKGIGFFFGGKTY